jgi:hypothetical protein
MKILVFLIISTMAVSCGSHPSKSDVVINTNVLVENANGPKNGTCTLELMAKKSINFKKDDFGILYPVISEGEKTILKYTYNKYASPKYQDGHYTEIIYAEFDSVLHTTSIENKELEQFKFHFGRLCFCKGETGYYPLTRGKFKLGKKGKDSVRIELNFEVKEVPQIVKDFCEIISIKSN